jgi:hypothetical protein
MAIIVSDMENCKGNMDIPCFTPTLCRIIDWTPVLTLVSWNLTYGRGVWYLSIKKQ